MGEEGPERLHEAATRLSRVEVRAGHGAGQTLGRGCLAAASGWLRPLVAA